MFKVVIFDDEKPIASVNFHSRDVAVAAMQDALAKGHLADMVDLSLLDTETALKIAPFIGSTI